MRLALFNKVSSKDRIDKSAGVIFGVSVISQGDAIGHGLLIDDKTLEQVKTLGSQFDGGLKVRMNHPKDGSDAPVQSIVGCLKNFRVQGKQTRADLHLLKTDSNFDKILELAEKMPESFGLSIVFTGKHEQDDDVKLARCTEIYACDLVDDPAANPTGLFSKPNTNMSKEIKYKKGDAGDHADDCECKMCMSKGKMSAILASLGLDENTPLDQLNAKLEAAGFKKLPAKDDEEEQKKAAKKKADDDKAAEISTKLAAIDTELEQLRAERKQGIALAQKAEIETLCADAAREGKVIPYDKDDLYSEEDGVLTIKVQPSQLSKMISKLPKGQVKLSKQPETPKGADGKPVQIMGLGKRRRGNEAQLAATREFCERIREQNAPVIGAHIKRLQSEAMETQSMN